MPLPTKQVCFFILLVVFFLCTNGGCNKTRPKTIPVKGQVTLNGGKWPGKGNITFRCIKPAEGYIQRPGSAIFDEEGNFTAGSYVANDGLVPGEYEVLVVYSKPQVSGEGVAEKPIIGMDKIAVSVEKGAIEDYRFDVKN